MPWVFQQVSGTPGIKPIVLAQHLQNLDRFAFRPIVSAPRSGLSGLSFRLMRRLRIVDYPASFVRALRANKAALLHSHFGDRAWFDRRLAQDLRLPHVVTFYGYDVNRLVVRDARWRERYGRLFRTVAMVLCEGPYMARALIALGCPEQKVSLQPIGVDLKRLPYRPRWPSGRETLRILVAATFREKKGIPYAIEAASLLAKRGVDVAVTVIGDSSGTPDEDMEKRRILDIMTRTGLAARVRMMGFQPYEVVLDEAYRHHLFLSPSVVSSDGDTEGGAPVSIIEMAASGLPVVATRHCDIPFVLAGAESELLADERDSVQLADRIESMIAAPESVRGITDRLRSRVETQFNLDTQLAELSRKYASLL